MKLLSMNTPNTQSSFYQVFLQLSRQKNQSRNSLKWSWFAVLFLLLSLPSTTLWAAPEPTINITHACHGTNASVSYSYSGARGAVLEWHINGAAPFTTTPVGTLDEAELGEYEIYLLIPNSSGFDRYGPFNYLVYDITPDFTYSIGGTCNGVTNDQSIQVNLNNMHSGITYEIEIEELSPNPPTPVPATMTSSTYTFTNLSANQYAVRITADGVCTSSETIVVSDENLPINVSTTIGTCNEIGGNIRVQLPNFQAGEIYDISVRNTANNHVVNYQQTSSVYDLTNVATGNYEVSVSIGSCTSSSIVDVVTLEAQASVEVDTTGTCQWYWQASLPGGIIPTSYTWTLLDVNQNEITTLPANYTVSPNGNEMWLGITGIGVDAVDYIKLLMTTADGCTYETITPVPSDLLFPEYPHSKQPSHTTTEASCQANDGTLTIDWSHMQVNPLFTPTTVTYQLQGWTSPQSTTIPTGATQLTIPDLEAGTYDIGFTTASGCHQDEFTLSETVSSNTAFVIESSVQPYCQNGAVTQMEVLSPSANDGATYQWGEFNGNIIAGATSAVFDAPSHGSYTVTVTYGGCTVTESFATISYQFDGDVVIDDINCGQDGKVILKADSLAIGEPFSFSVGGTNSLPFFKGQSRDIEINTPGTYNLTINSIGLGCSQGYNVTLTEVGVNVEFYVANPSSCVSNDGALSVNLDNIKPETPPTTYLYNWSTGATTFYINNLSLGSNYSVTVTDANDADCKGTASKGFSDTEYRIHILQSWSAPSCAVGNYGEMYVGSHDNSPPEPYTYQWAGPNGFTSTSPMISNLANGGGYNLTITDANGCTYTDYNIVRNDWVEPEILLEPIVACQDNQVGFRFLNYNSWTACSSIDVNIYRRDLSAPKPEDTDVLVQTITFNQSSSAHEHTFPNTDAFDPTVAYVYEFTNCCNAFASEKIEVRYSGYQPNLATANITPASCQTLGSIVLNATGDYAPYQYTWQDGIIADTRSDLQPGSYVVTITGNQGCAITQTVDIPGTSGAPTLVNTAACNGTISLAASNITNGSAPYTVQWSLNGGATQSTTTLSQAGQYSISITDANGCIGVQQLTLDPHIFTAIANTQSPSCDGSDGSIDLQVTNTSSPIVSYQWSGPSGQDFVGAQLQGLTAGSYAYTITDQNTCTKTGTVQLPSNTPINANFLAGCNPQITTISGGQPPYEVLFTAVHTDPLQASFQVNLDANTVYPYTLSGLDEGDYDIQVRDANGCISSTHSINTINTAQTRRWDIKMQWYRSEVPTTSNPTYPLATVIKNDLEGQVQNFLEEADQLGKEADLCERQGQDELGLEYSQSLHHYTLYYYNLRDELVRTVPPAGVSFIQDNGGTALTDLITYRADVTPTVPSQLLPEHMLVTQYNQNALGQAISSKTPDKGVTNSFYTSEGLLRFAQDAKQVVDNTYSYTLYDELERVIETGEILYTGVPSQVEVNNLNFLPNGAIRQEHVKTFYTSPHVVDGTHVSYYHNSNKKQRHLRNRVSYTESHQNGLVVTSTYSYDIYGNVEWVRQYIDGFGENYVAYDYDLFTKLVRKIRYNEYSKDRFFHKYEYDEQNRLRKVYTSTDGFIWDRDAVYDYYAHGPLARKELGEDRIQGLDYLYTIHSWIKSINHPDLSYDLGQDGQPGSINAVVMPDILGFSLSYYQGDFNRFGMQQMIDYSHDNRNLYNGNVSAWANGVNTTALSGISGFTSVVDESLTQRNFTYDELDRIKTSKLLTLQGGVLQPAWNNAFSTNYSYDGNGNLQELKRWGSQSLIDDVNYNYGTGNLANRLLSIEDQAGGNGVGDLQQEQGYNYDEIGNLVRSTVGNPSLPDEALDIIWRVDGKVEQVDILSSGINSQLKFIYDATGNRVAKVYDPNLSVINDEYNTYYVRDSKGNILGVYQKYHIANNFEVSISERIIGGTKRLGQQDERIVFNDTTLLNRNANNINNSGVYSRHLDVKKYILTDHLENSTILLSDQKQLLGNSYNAQIESYQQFYPFGWNMPQRNVNTLISRFGFNGKENDQEWGTSLIQDYGFRLYNPAIGKFLSVDPLAPNYPWYTPYQFAGNKPINSIDLDGLEEEKLIDQFEDGRACILCFIWVETVDGVVNGIVAFEELVISDGLEGMPIRWIMDDLGIDYEGLSDEELGALFSYRSRGTDWAIVPQTTIFSDVLDIVGGLGAFYNVLKPSGSTAFFARLPPNTIASIINVAQAGKFAKQAEAINALKKAGKIDEYKKAVSKFRYYGKYTEVFHGPKPAPIIVDGVKKTFHGHHIVEKMSSSGAASRAILEKYGIDPVWDPDNLVWAPFKTANVHGALVQSKIYEELSAIDRSGVLTQSAKEQAIRSKLVEIGKKVATLSYIP